MMTYALRVSLAVFMLSTISCTIAINRPVPEEQRPARSASQDSSTKKLNTVHYPIRHRAEKSGELAPVSIEHGDLLDIEISETNRDCYFYNSRVTEIDFVDQMKAGEQAPQPENVHLTVTHDESVIAYVVEITPKGTKECEDADKILGARTYTIPVRALWNLVGAAGFVAHDLVNPEFYLQPQPAGGYIVRRQAENEDDNVISGAGMLHLWRSGRGFKGISWAPLSFGLSIDEKRSDYLLGTSARFGKSVYVTFGRIFGNVNRLPNGVAIDYPTDNANALASLPTRRKGAWYVSASFGFLSAGVSNLFKTKVGSPQVPGGTAASSVPGVGGGGSQTPSITAKPAAGFAGEPVVLDVPEGVAFGAAAANSRLAFTDAKGIATTFPSTAVTWADKQITFNVPQSAAVGEAKIEVFVADRRVATSKFNVIFKLTVTPDHGANTVKVELSGPAGVNFGDPADNSFLLLQQAGQELKLLSRNSNVDWKKEKITFIPGGFVQGDVVINVNVGGNLIGRAKYKVD